MKSKQEGNGAHQQAGAQHCTAPDDASHFIFLLQVKEMCQNKLGGSRGLSKSHQSLCCLFCFCARQQCQLPLEFLRLRELLCLAALPKDAAYSSCSCKPFKSASHFAFGTYTDPSERQSSHPADAKIHFAPSSILPKSGWSSAQQPPAFFLLRNPFNSLWCFCCAHKAFQSYRSPLNFKAKHTNTWLCASTATHHEEWEPADCQFFCYLDSKR